MIAPHAMAFFSDFPSIKMRKSVLNSRSQIYDFEQFATKKNLDKQLNVKTAHVVKLLRKIASSS
jgi:hypothetical protein